MIRLLGRFESFSKNTHPHKEQVCPAMTTGRARRPIVAYMGHIRHAHPHTGRTGVRVVTHMPHP